MRHLTHCCRTSFSGSKSTATSCGFGGYQGRRLYGGDLLFMAEQDGVASSPKLVTLPVDIVPTYEKDWKVYTMGGPHEEGFFTEEGLELIYNTKW